MVVFGEFFVNEVSFQRVEVGSFSLVLQDLHCFLDVANGCECSRACTA